jgi:protein-(glutamine-N5) methyltransferase, release factor-specific
MPESFNTYNDLLIYAVKEFENVGIEEASVEARNILLYTFNISLLDFSLNRNKELGAKEKIEKFLSFVEERKKRKPFQYIINKQNFYGLDFYVDENVLIPRFDTEVLVEKILKDNKGNNFQVLDLCTGSGAIAISLKKLGEYKSVKALDISEKALDIAKKNSSLNETTIDFICSDMFEKIDGKFDIIVSNPPYIPSRDIEDLSLEVKDYEPKLALDGLEDGLYFYRIIAKEAKAYLKENGKIYLEIGYNQAKDIREIFKEYNKIEVYKDLAGKDRVVKIS